MRVSGVHIQVSCSLLAVECGRDKVLWERGTTGVHATLSPSTGSLVLLFTDRAKDKLRGKQRNGAQQKLVIEVGSLWSAWISTPVGSPARLHLALSSAPACLVRMYSGTENWVRRDDRRILGDCSTCNIVVLHGEEAKLQLMLAQVHRASSATKHTPVQPMSYRLPVLVARAELYREQGQQKRVSNTGVGLFVSLKKAKSTEERRAYQAQCNALHRQNNYRWQLYLRACWRRQATISAHEKRQREFRLPCLSCGITTLWDHTSGIRRGLDGVSHHFCKKLLGFNSKSFDSAPWLKAVFRARVTL